jgi:signal transduction histidine kinase
MGVAVAFVLGAATMAPLALWLWRRLRAAEGERRYLAGEAALRREILAAAPDGLFLWDHRDGGETCSRRLAVLLDLAAGTDSRYPDIRGRFRDQAAADLDRAVEFLRRDGGGFDLLLPAAVAGGRRMMRIVGVRACHPDGRPLADLLWMRLGAEDQTDGAADGNDGDHFRALLDALPLPVWLRGADLELVFTNRACEGQAVAEPASGLAARAKAEGKPLSESRLPGPGEEARLLEVTETPVEGWTGSLGFALEHSRRERMQEDDSRDVQGRDRVLDTLAVGIAVFDADGGLSFCNRSYAELWGLDAGWLAAKPTLGEILDRLREQRRLPEVTDFRAFKEQQLARFKTLTEPAQSLIHLPDGGTLRAVVGPHGPGGGLVFSYEDVSKRLALERSYNSLIAVQGETLDNLYEGVAVFGGDGRLKLANPVFAKLWNLREEDLSGEPHMTNVVETMRPLLAAVDDWPAHKNRIVARLIGRQPSSGRLPRSDGSVVDYANVPLPDGAVLLSYLDVTDGARVEVALRQRAEALEEAGRLKSEFIANVSYEVRTPLTSIIGFADVLCGDHFGKLNKRQNEYSRGILEASQGLMSIIEDILDLATIEAGMMTLELDTVDLHCMLASVLGLIRERARRKSLKVDFDCPPDIGWLVADEKRLKQVLFNLLGNAIEFTPPRGHVRLRAARQGGEVLLIVADTGIGIPERDRQRVFETFERGGATTKPQDSASRAGGAGLGLPLVKRFIELHGGRVEVKSAAGKGTTVTCRLPAEAAPLGEMGTEEMGN